MNKSTLLGLLAIVATAPNAGHAFTYDAVAGQCLVNNQTWICHVAWTQATASEALLNGAVLVQGTFDGPAYSVQKRADKFLSVFLPFTWYVEVKYEHCAHSGVHSASGLHLLSVDGFPGPEEETYSPVVQWTCDCGPVE